MLRGSDSKLKLGNLPKSNAVTVRRASQYYLRFVKKNDDGVVKMSSLLYSYLLLSSAVPKTPWLQLHPSRAAHSQFYVGPQPAPTRLLPAFTPLPAATHPPPAPIIRTRTASFFSYYSEGSANFTNAIAVHRASITTAMPISYMLAVDGRFSCVAPPFNTSHSALSDCAMWDERARQVQSLGIPTTPTVTLPPGYVGTGVARLLASSALQRTFVDAAVATSVAKNHSGLTIDFENSGGHSTRDLVAFLTKLAAGLHAAGKTLACAYGGGWLNPEQLRSAGLDRLQDMTTYDGQADAEEIRRHIADVGGASRYCFGLDPSLPPGYSPATIARQFKAAETAGVQHVCVWEDHEKDIPAQLWVALAAFLNGTAPPPPAPTPPPTPPLPGTCGGVEKDTNIACAAGAGKCALSSSNDPQSDQECLALCHANSKCAAWAFHTNWKVPECFLFVAPATLGGAAEGLDSGVCGVRSR